MFYHRPEQTARRTSQLHTSTGVMGSVGHGGKYFDSLVKSLGMTPGKI